MGDVGTTLTRRLAVVFARDGRGRERRGADGGPCKATRDELFGARCTARSCATARQPVRCQDAQGLAARSDQARVDVRKEQEQETTGHISVIFQGTDPVAQGRGESGCVGHVRVACVVLYVRC